MNGLQSLVLTRAVLAPAEEAVAMATSLIFQQDTVVTFRTMRTLASASGALYICRPEPWFL